MRFAIARLAHRARLRRVPLTARLRLTALYGGLFLLCGAALIAITYLLYVRATGRGRRDAGHPSPWGVKAAKLLQASAQIASDRHQLLINSGIALAIVAVIALTLGWFMAGRVMRPVRTITATARRISASNLRERLALENADEEFKQLGDTLDDLFARLEASFDAQRHFVANASHELRTPLTAERTLLQVALDDPDTSPDAWRSTAELAIASNRGQERLIEALLTLARSEAGIENAERIDLSAICDRVLRQPGLVPERLGLRVDTVIHPALLEGDPELIERLVANLVDNAVEHNIAGGTIQISSCTRDDRAVLSVTNTGPIIPPGDVPRLFRPFERLNGRRGSHTKGHGVGLSIVKAIATAHRATISACPQPRGGLSIRVTFPRPTEPDGIPGHTSQPKSSLHEPKARLPSPPSEQPGRVMDPGATVA